MIWGSYVVDRYKQADEARAEAKAIALRTGKSTKVKHHSDGYWYVGLSENKGSLRGLYEFVQGEIEDYNEMLRNEAEYKAANPQPSSYVCEECNGCGQELSDQGIRTGMPCSYCGGSGGRH